MEARASFDNQSSSRALVVLMAAVVAALLVGGAGGYVVRALTFTAGNAVTTQVHRPFVVEPVPYSTPVPSQSPPPLRDPNGHQIPI